MAVTLYWVAYADGGGTPSGAQIVAGQDSTGSAALASGSEAYTSAGTYDEATAITSLSASTAYRVAWVAYDGTSYSAVPTPSPAPQPSRAQHPRPRWQPTAKAPPARWQPRHRSLRLPPMLRCRFWLPLLRSAKAVAQRTLSQPVLPAMT